MPVRGARALWWLAAAGIAAGSVLAMRPRPPAGDRPNLLLVTIDTMRADHVSGYGYARSTTPHLDALMAEGAAFLHAYTPMPTTGPAHATLFTATYPAVHGVVKNGYVLPATRPTLAEVLRSAGYRTGAVVSAFPLARRFGYDRGFGDYDDAFPLATATIDTRDWEGFALAEAFDRRADATTDRALAWLAAGHAAAPWFLWVHYYDPHAPYDPPPATRGRFRRGPEEPPRTELARSIAAYDAEIAFTDEQLGRLVRGADDRFGAGRTLVVVASDHGEGLMQHGWMEHGVNLYEELVRAALVVRWPGRVSPRRLAVPAGLVDVAPTALVLLGLTPLAGDGRDLSAALLAGDDTGAERPLFFQRRVYTSADRRDHPVRGAMTGLRLGPWKYVEAPEQGAPELFDLRTDPGETRNLAASDPETSARLAVVLARWRAQPGAAAAQDVDADTAARLRALGYVD